ASVFGRETSAEADANMIKESGEQLKACRVDKSAGYGQVLYPSAGQENTQIQIAVPADLTTQPVIDGKNAIIIRGCVMYDTFAATRHSTFCFFFINGKTNASHLSFCSGTSEAT